MLATLRRLLLVSAGAIALSASGLAQVNTDISNVMAQAKAAHERDDYAEAIRWYRVAADQGSAAAQFNLGVLYENGQGVTQNYVEAYKWWSLAAAQGNRNAVKNRDIFRTEMTPAQIAEGQRLVAAWRPK